MCKNEGKKLNCEMKNIQELVGIALKIAVNEVPKVRIDRIKRRCRTRLKHVRNLIGG